MPADRPRLLVVVAAGLGHELVTRTGFAVPGLTFRPMDTVFPALTCPVQATLRTGLPPSGHGMTANGLFFREQAKVSFWDQSSRLVSGPRFWHGWRKAGRRVAMLFWQQSMGEDADIILSPAPIHRHHGGMVESCYEQPAGLYDRLCRTVGRPFRLSRYWGPLASPASSQWIAEATAALIADPDLAPDLCLSYLPALDYDLQRHGPAAPASCKALEQLAAQLALLQEAASRQHYATIFLGDYAIDAVTRGPLYPNRVLRDAGWLRCRTVDDRLYLDLHSSRAFALCDHEIAHVYARDPGDTPALAALFASASGLRASVTAHDQPELRHGNAGDLVLVANDGHWLAYPWWTRSREAPDYARHVDIHNKPGYDPCELFFGWPPGSVSTDPDRIRGSHGRAGETRRTAWAANGFPAEGSGPIELSGRIGRWLQSE